MAQRHSLDLAPNSVPLGSTAGAPKALPKKSALSGKVGATGTDPWT